MAKDHTNHGLLPCAACQALRRNTRPRGPHKNLKRVWSDPAKPFVSVYVCKYPCNAIMVENLRAPVNRWTYDRFSSKRRAPK